MTKWWERLQAAMTRHDIDADAVAQRAGIPRKSVYSYLDGDVENPRGDVMRRLAEAVHMSEIELRYGASQIPIQVKKIPLTMLSQLNFVATFEAAMGSVASGELMSAPSLVPDDAFGLNVDNGMGSPEINLGDVLICSPSARVEPGKLVVAVNTAVKLAVFGRLKLLDIADPRRFIIQPPNSSYPEIVIDDASKGFVLARVVMHIRHT